MEYPKPLTTLEMLLESLQSSETNAFSGTALENVAEAFISAKENLHGKVYARLPFDMIAQ